MTKAIMARVAGAPRRTPDAGAAAGGCLGAGAGAARPRPKPPRKPSRRKPPTVLISSSPRRSGPERLQDVPIAVSALGGDSLERQRVTQADELASKIVNLQLTSTVGDNTPIFALRGVSMSDYSLNQASPVATYSLTRSTRAFAFLGVAMYDLERVEVLRARRARSMARTPPAARST